MTTPKVMDITFSGLIPTLIFIFLEEDVDGGVFGIIDDFIN